MTTPRPRINARATDAFDLIVVRFYDGPNPYLGRRALVWDFALTGAPTPPPLVAIHRLLTARFPTAAFPAPPSSAAAADYAALFGHTVRVISQLDWGLQLTQLAIEARPDGVQRVAVECLHGDTTWDSLYLAWDWWESLHQPAAAAELAFDSRFTALQQQFNRSIYGGPTTYSLLRAAAERQIPTLFLADEGLIQYGYGRHARRGIATTFDRDSHLDSDFTCRKDDCKQFLHQRGFPVPTGEVVDNLDDALEVAAALGYPVVVKPLMGHKGIGVTAGIDDDAQLAFAWQKAVETLPPEAQEAPAIIVERFVVGDDYRLLCVNGQFAAALKREPAFVIGDGKRTIRQLIDAENATPARADTATSPLGKIRCDDAMAQCLAEQRLAEATVLPKGQKVKLRKVANLSLGGVSENVTDRIHPANVALCNAIASQFQLLCLGIDALTGDISRPWDGGDFGIIEINAAPGIAMHLNPAVGAPVDVPGKILDALFPDPLKARMPTVLFNRLYEETLEPLLLALQRQFPRLTLGGMCGDGVWLDGQRQPFSRRHYARNVRHLLRHPHLDLLIVECWGDLFYDEGCPVQGAHLVVLDNPSSGEKLLSRELLPGGTLITKQQHQLSFRRGSRLETQRLDANADLVALYLREIAALLGG